jgi:hypothetical protein
MRVVDTEFACSVSNAVCRQIDAFLGVLSDTYLKYLGWALSDKSPLVRTRAVAAIARLYQDR